ncbi:MAG: hypothetical protein LLG00_08265 [Planctomycetaceae bacterium]|nr:hypothetical protein [Planctomycetaceae bacterium]
MRVRHLFKWCVATALAGLVVEYGLNKAVSAPPATPAPSGPASAEQGVQVLTRGPVHEAFAETVTFDPVPGIVAPKAPPAAIEELPPEQRPEGDNVAWIPGYWGWDEDRNDFLWVSGVWRDLPPGRQWVPGYWVQSAQGYQWTSGYWADAKASEVEYLPEPPATVEAGPNIAASSADQTWLPGCWVWQQGRYAWRPGFWAAAQPNWLWVPPHYVWAPRGYVFVDGYWDYSLDRRGVLFAPVYFGAGVYGRRGFSYSPTTVIDLGVFTNHLFVRPRYQHYYFGDYYAPNYQAAGFYPSYSYNSGRYGYDPIYAYDRWQHRQDRGWEQRQQAEFLNRRNHEALRPPHTWAEQRAMAARAVQPGARSSLVAAPLDQFRRNPNSSVRFQPVDQVERQRLARQAQDVQRFRQQRQLLENNAVGGPAGTRGSTFAPAKVRLPGSPIVARPDARLSKGRIPPKSYEAPRLDPNVAAKPRVNQTPGQPQQRTASRVPLDQPRQQPQPKVERQRPQPQPKVDQPRQQPQPKVERQRQQPQPKVERQRPQPQPKVERATPQPQPRVERAAPQPRVERQAPQPRGKDQEGPPSAGPKQDQPRGRDKN